MLTSLTAFAQAVMHTRLPTILGKAIDDTTQTLNEQYDEEKGIRAAKGVNAKTHLPQSLTS
jgi:hypothetical protein